MGSPPPPDAPPPETQDAITADASFEASPPAASLCGFGLPTFSFSIKLFIPPFPPPFPPNLALFLSLNCDLNDPLDAELSFGGGRVPLTQPDPDEQDT